MKKTMPVAATFFLAAVVFAAGYLVKAGSDRKDRQGAAREAVSSPDKGDQWSVYEDKFLKLQYPRDWSVEFWHDKATPRHSWSVQPSDYEFSQIAVEIWENLDGKEKRPLSQIFKETNWTGENFLSARVGPVSPVTLKGAECLYAALESDWNDVYVEADGRTRIQRKCIQPQRHALCYTDKGHYVEVYADQGMYCDRQKPDRKTQAYIDIYERVLRSLEFKRG